MNQFNDGVSGIQDVYGNYLINVPHTYSKKIKYAGATITYKHDGLQYRDSLEIRGPTTETLKVVVLYSCRFIFNLLLYHTLHHETNEVNNPSIP